MAKGTYKFYYFDWTGLGEISRYIFALNDVKYEDIRIPLNDENFPALAPKWKSQMTWGQVPMLEVDGKKIAQASAINRYLARRYNLAGANEFESAKCDEFVDAIKDWITELLKISMERDPTKQAEIKKNVLEVATPKFFSIFNKTIAENGGKGLVGDSLTWADIYLCHFATYFEEFFNCVYVKNYPAIEGMVQKFFERPQIKNWLATRPKLINFNMDILNEKMNKLMKK